jgi:hypothetical protein
LDKRIETVKILLHVFKRSIVEIISSMLLTYVFNLTK